MTSADVIPFRIRPDLQWAVHEPAPSGNQWLATDPISREHYLFDEVEKSIVEQLDGQASLDLIFSELLSRYGDFEKNTISRDRIHDLVQRLDHHNLLLRRSWSMTGVKPKPKFLRRSWNLVGNLLSLRVRLFDPTPVLKWTSTIAAVLFSVWMIPVLLFAITIGCIAIVGRFQSVMGDAIQFNSSAQLDRMIVTASLLIVVKVLHEFGHAMACRRFGGNCDEMGVIFLLGVPCFYCDVSDSWRLPNRWHRIMIAAGGIYFEILVSLIACWVWFVSESFWYRGVSIQIMIACTLMTILVNGNPLLKYDGYYILSDLFRIPNLSEQSREAFLNDNRSRRSVAGRLALSVYFVASVFNRWFLLGGLIFGITAWFSERRLENFANAFRIVVCLSFVILSYQLIHSFIKRQPIRVRTFRLVQIAWLLVFGAGLWILFFYPWPQGIIARGMIEPVQTRAIYSRKPARLVFALEGGSTIQVNQLVAQFESPELDMEMERTDGEIRVATARQSHLQRRTIDDPDAAQLLVETEETLRSLVVRKKQLENERESLQHHAPIAGQFIDHFNVNSGTDSLPDLGTARHDINRVALDRPTIAQGKMIASITDPTHWIVRAYVTERDISRLELGKSVQVRVDQSPRRQWVGTIVSVSPDPSEKVPDSLVNDSLFITTIESPKKSSADSKSSVVTVQISHETPPFHQGGLATVYFTIAPRTVFEITKDAVAAFFGNHR